VLSIFDDVSLIFIISIINIDKCLRRPSRRYRQSSKVYRVITNLVRHEDTQVVDGKLQNENSVYLSICHRSKVKSVRHLPIDIINENMPNPFPPGTPPFVSQILISRCVI
jgi:hypothetical protein